MRAEPGADPATRHLSASTVGRLCLLAGMWGSSFLLIKVAIEGLSTAQLVLVRLVVGASVLAGLVAVRRLPLPRSPRVWAHFLVLGLLANIGPFALFAWAEQRVSSGRAGVLNATTPLLTLAIASLALADERWSTRRFAGIAVGFTGVVLVVGPGGGSAAGQAACLAAALLYSMGFVYVRRFLSGLGQPSLVLALGQIGTAALAMVVAAPLVARQPLHLDARVVAAVVALGALSTGVAYVVSFSLVRDVGATATTTSLYLVPVVAVALGVVVLGEHIGWNLLVGTAVILCGLAVADGRLPALGSRLLSRRTQ